MNLFILDEKRVAEAAELAAFVSKPENWYSPGEGAPVPGEDPRFTRQWETYKVVFTWTRTPTPEQGVIKHLSISVQGAGRMPTPIAALTLAKILGFTGGKENPPGSGLIEMPGDNWQVGVHQVDKCIVLAQPVTEDELKAATGR